VNDTRGFEAAIRAAGSEASCLTCGCKSRWRRVQYGAVVIPGSRRGDLTAESPEVNASVAQSNLSIQKWASRFRSWSGSRGRCQASVGPAEATNAPSGRKVASSCELIFHLWPTRTQAHRAKAREASTLRPLRRDGGACHR
jgi:hypothetical protein